MWPLLVLLSGAVLGLVLAGLSNRNTLTALRQRVLVLEAGDRENRIARSLGSDTRDRVMDLTERVIVVEHQGLRVERRVERALDGLEDMLDGVVDRVQEERVAQDAIPTRPTSFERVLNEKEE